MKMLNVKACAAATLVLLAGCAATPTSIVKQPDLGAPDAGRCRRPDRRRDLQREHLPSDVRGPPRASHRRHPDRQHRREDLGQQERRQHRQQVGQRDFGVPARCRASWAPSINASAATKYADGDTQTASNAFTGTIGVTVSEVLPNGNLIVVGEKQVAMNKGIEFIRFSGMVNPDTIQPGNTVSSTLVADARVEYRTNSQIDRAEMTSMMSRFFQSLLPF
jgi:flagellar L-ring protein precursor FlgH